MISRVEARCRELGLIISTQRKLIAEVLSEAKDHPDVPELHRRVRVRDERISLATVYRTVKQLVEVGVLQRHAFRDGRSRYELAAEKHHDHLIDLDTGNVVEFRSPEIENLNLRIARKLGYRLIGHRLELYAKAAVRNK